MSARSASRSWSTPADVVASLRRRWDSGSLLARYASGDEWEPIGVPLRAPTATEVASDFGAVQDWVRSWIAPGRPGFRVETAAVGGRVVGLNELPRRAWVDSYADAWRILRTTDLVRAFESALSLAEERAPRIAEWARAHPMAVLQAGETWDELLRTVRWIDANAASRHYLREIDVPGVDTKFIEQHRAILTTLLEVQLDAERIDGSRPRTDFAGRFGFLTKPEYVRMRALSGDLIPGFSEMTLRLDELAGRPPGFGTFVIVENEVTFLALPAATDAVAILSGGYAVSRLARLPWLAERRVLYWGDLDTHGFAMLSQLRASAPHATSLLMDRATLLAHEGQWVREPKPTNARLPGLNEAEHALYVDLIEDRYGIAVRLEQERIAFSAVRAALSPHCR
ncbi:unannotated protein [freshwater metagenome]|uniref:Unannotated protein n=1 Tax=freshwater metagenome TaxID=449393 RepID=A0A6J7MXU9_9ZZZZ